MSITEHEFAKANNYHRLGKSEIPVKVQLSVTEKIEYGKMLTEAVVQIKKLEAELSEIKKNFKERKEIHKETINEASKLLTMGYRFVDKMVPCFLDKQNNQKHWIDIETGEIIKTAQADEEDSQMSFE